MYLIVATYISGDLNKAWTVTFGMPATSQATEKKNYQVWKAQKEGPCFSPRV